MIEERENELTKEGRIFRVIKDRKGFGLLLRGKLEVWDLVILKSTAQPSPKAKYKGPHVMVGRLKSERVIDMWLVPRPRILEGGLQMRESGNCLFPSPNELDLSAEELIERHKDSLGFRGFLKRLRKFQ